MKHSITKPLETGSLMAYAIFAFCLQVFAADGNINSEEKQVEKQKANEIEAVDDWTTYDKRLQAIQKAVYDQYQARINRPYASFPDAIILYSAGKNAEADRLADAALATMDPSNPKHSRWIDGGNSGFTVWPGIHCYSLYKDQMSPELIEKFKRVYTGAVFYRRLSTSNHVLMAAVTSYLARQEWKDEEFVPDPFFKESQRGGRIFTKHDPNGEKELKKRIEGILKGGPGEYASRPYGMQNILPIFSIAVCSHDKELAAKARMAYELSILQLAPVYLRGHLATFAPRSYPDVMTQSPWGGAKLAWLYFGGIKSDRLTGGYELLAVASNYRFPDPLVIIGTERSKPYRHRALINKWTLDHWMTPNYGLFSRSSKAAGYGWAGQSLPCGVMWEDRRPNRGSHLWITTPAADEKGKMGIHTHGIRTRYEEQMLARDTLLSVYNIDPKSTFPYAMGYLPGGYKTIIDESKEGRIWLHYGVVLICVAAANPMEYDPAAGIAAPATKPLEGDSEFRVRHPKTAIVLETASPDEFTGDNPQKQLEAFCAKLKEKCSLEFDEATCTGTYRNRYGEVLRLEFKGKDSVNGVENDYTKWPVMDNPWMLQEASAGPLTVKVGEKTWIYDLQNFIVTDPEK